MNTAQRKYLVDRLKETGRKRIDALKKTVPDPISLNVYMLHKVMSSDFEIRPQEELRAVIFNKAMKAGQVKTHREDWLGNPWGSSSRPNVAFDMEEIFVIPQEYLDMVAERNAAREKVLAEIRELENQLDTLEVRIMVASDKALAKLVSEIDDMGDIRLVDTKIKLLT